MALHTELPIYRTGVQLLALAVKVQEQMPRGVKRSLGDKIAQHCVEMLDLMALVYFGPPPTGFAGPLKGAPPLARQSRLHGGRLTARPATVLHSARRCTTAAGIGVPIDSAASKAASRPLRLFHAGPASMAALAGSRKARRLPLRGVTGTPTRQGCRPDWRRGGSHSLTDPSEANLAHLFTAREERIVQRARVLLERPLRDPSLPAFDRLDVVRDYLRARFAGLDHEQAHALYLNSQHVLIAAEVVSIGTLAQCPVYPREVARRALHHNAGAVILAHNHPSGCATPSAADQQLTRALQTALLCIDVRLLDHVVVSGNALESAAGKGLL